MGRGDFAICVGHALVGDGREQDRVLKRAPEQPDARVSAGERSKHPR